MAMNTGRIRVHATETWNHDVPTASKLVPLEAERGEGYSPHDPEAFAKMEPHPTGARYDTTTVFSTKRGIQRGKHQSHCVSAFVTSMYRLVNLLEPTFREYGEIGYHGALPEHLRIQDPGELRRRYFDLLNTGRLDFINGNSHLLEPYYEKIGFPRFVEDIDVFSERLAEEEDIEVVSFDKIAYFKGVNRATGQDDRVRDYRLTAANNLSKLEIEIKVRVRKYGHGGKDYGERDRRCDQDKVYREFIDRFSRRLPGDDRCYDVTKQLENLERYVSRAMSAMFSGNKSSFEHRGPESQCQQYLLHDQPYNAQSGRSAAELTELRQGNKMVHHLESLLSKPYYRDCQLVEVRLDRPWVHSLDHETRMNQTKVKMCLVFQDTLDRLYSNDKRAANILALQKRVQEPADEDNYAVVDTLETGAKKTPETEATQFKVPELPVPKVKPSGSRGVADSTPTLLARGRGRGTRTPASRRVAALGTKPSSPKSPALFPAGDVSATSSSDDSESETTESLVPVRVPKMKVAMYGPDKQTGSSPGEQTDEQDEALDDVEKLPQVPMDASEAEMEQQNESREATPEPREKTPEPREKTPEPQEEVPEQAENAPASPAGEVVIATIDLTGDSDEAMPTDESADKSWADRMREESETEIVVKGEPEQEVVSEPDDKENVDNEDAESDSRPLVIDEQAGASGSVLGTRTDNVPVAAGEKPKSDDVENEKIVKPVQVRMSRVTTGSTAATEDEGGPSGTPSTSGTLPKAPRRAAAAKTSKKTKSRKSAAKKEIDPAVAEEQRRKGNLKKQLYRIQKRQEDDDRKRQAEARKIADIQAALDQMEQGADSETEDEAGPETKRVRQSDK